MSDLPRILSSVTGDTPQAQALARLADLRACLDGAPDRAQLATLIEQTDQLARSVESFHLEGIRFRYFGLRRQLTTYDGTLPDGTIDHLDQVGQALGAAGFQIGSA